jgi:hypothetical protein
VHEPELVERVVEMTNELIRGALQVIPRALSVQRAGLIKHEDQVHWRNRGDSLRRQIEPILTEDPAEGRVHGLRRSRRHRRLAEEIGVEGKREGDPIHAVHDAVECGNRPPGLLGHRLAEPNARCRLNRGGVHRPGETDLRHVATPKVDRQAAETDDSDERNGDEHKDGPALVGEPAAPPIQAASHQPGPPG